MWDYFVACKDNTHFGKGQAKYIYGVYFLSRKGIMCGFAQILEVGLKPDPIDKALNKRDNFVKNKHRIPCTGYAVFGVWVVWWGRV